MIEVKDLVKRYGEKTAVDGLSFTLSDGGVHGFLGPNGAGKSTTMNIITGCLSATSGEVMINGVDISADPVAAKKKIGYLPEIPPLYEDMTPYEYLIFVGEAKNVPYDKLYKNVKSVMELTYIDDVKGQLIKNLSKGYKQRVGLAQTMLGNPEIIILDEPTVGLDPRQISEIRDLIRRLGEIKTVIISSHILSEISELCDDVLIISHGKMIAHDTIENLNMKLSGTQALKVSVRGDEEAVVSALEAVENIRDCIVLDVCDGVVSLKIEFDAEVDIRDSVFAAFAEAECPILSMDTEALTLEDIYLKLTDDILDCEETEALPEEETRTGLKKFFGKRGKKE